MKIVVETNGNWRPMYDENRNLIVEGWWHYMLPADGAKLTVEYLDGTVFTGTYEEVVNKIGFGFLTNHGQGYDDEGNLNTWELGGTYPVELSLGEVSTTYNVTIICAEDDHEWGEWVTTVPASTKADGEQERVCTVCGESETQALKLDVEIEYEESVFEKGTYIVVEKLEKNNEHHNHTEESLGKHENHKVVKFEVYDITALKDNVKVQPNGKVTVKFPVPEDFKGKVGVFYISDKGEVEFLGGKLSEDRKFIEVELEHFSLYAVAEIEDVENPNTGDILIYALSAVMALSVIAAFAVSSKKRNYNI